MTKQLGELGTVSHGTMRPQDLIPAFLSELERLDPAAYQQVMIPGAGFPAVPNHALEDEDADWWQSEDCGFVLDELFDALNEFAPEGAYFGAHPGDGSDYGFWMAEE